MGLNSFKNMISIDNSYLTVAWEDLRSDQSLYETLEVSESHRSTGTLCIPRPLRERRVVASTLRRRSYPKKRASGRATENSGPCNDSPSSWEVDSAPNLTLDLPYRRSPPPLSPGEVDRWLRGSRLLDTVRLSTESWTSCPLQTNLSEGSQAEYKGGNAVSWW